MKILYNLRSIIFFLSLTLVIFQISISVSAQEIFGKAIDTPILLTYLIAGVPSFIMGVFALYLMYKASKTYGGKLGSALVKLIISISFLLGFILILGIQDTLNYMGIKSPIIVFVLTGIYAAISMLVLIFGCRAILNSAKG